MTIYTYSPDDVYVTLSGHSVEGYSPDTFITVEASTPVFKSYKTTSGSVYRTLNKTSVFKLKLSLHQTSETNDFLWTLLTTDKNIEDAIWPLFIKDYGSGTSILAAQAWVCDYPKISYSNGLETREWEIEFTTETISISGGSGGESFMETALKLFSGAL